MKITYVCRSFLDYRIPVFEELNKLTGSELTVIFSADYIPQRVVDKARDVLDDRAVGMTGERRLGPDSTQGFANRAFRLVYQPGIFQAIAQSRPDVLVGDGFYQWTSFALAYRLKYGTPLVVGYERTAHTERNAQRIRTMYRRLALRFVDAMSVNGQLSREYSEWLGMPADRITCGQMAADTENLTQLAAAISTNERSALRAQWGDNLELIFVYSGQLIERKGIRELLNAWSRIEKEALGNHRLVLVGSGEMDLALRSQAAALCLRQVVFAGHVDYDAIAPYYVAADAFIAPTLEDNWSLVVPEAMACSLPVLCSKYNGCYPELIEPDGNGLVFDPLDEQDTFNALMHCIEKREQLKAMGQRSREIVSQHTPAHAARAILDACRIAVAHR